MDDLGGMPDNFVLTKVQTAVLIGLSPRSLDLLHLRGEGPKRFKPALRAWAYRAGDLKAWVAARVERPAAA